MSDENDCEQQMSTGACGQSPGAVSQLDLESLRASSPNWRLGGTPGNWFAVRGGLEAASGPQSLLRHCLSASTLEALAEKLCLPEHLDGLSGQELAGVWQRVKLPHSTEQAAS